MNRPDGRFARNAAAKQATPADHPRCRRRCRSVAPSSPSRIPPRRAAA